MRTRGTISHRDVFGHLRGSGAWTVALAAMVMVCGWLMWSVYIDPGASVTSRHAIPGADENTTLQTMAVPAAGFDSAASELRRLPHLGLLPLPALEATPPAFGDDLAAAGSVVNLYRDNHVGPGPSERPIIIPVDGVAPDELTDTYSLMRSEGRVHDAIDIVAPQGTPVLAAVDGTIARTAYSDRDGIAIYQIGADSTLVYYYAHLDQYADGLSSGTYVHQGDVIGYIGDSGSTQPGNYHLHFAIWRITDPRFFRTGDAINPYPLLKHAGR